MHAVLYDVKTASTLNRNVDREGMDVTEITGLTELCG